MNITYIENRVRELISERIALEMAHSELVQQNQKLNREFQEAVLKNQSRYAQIQGALLELEQLKISESRNGPEETVITYER